MTIYSLDKGFIPLATESGTEYHIGNVIGLYGSGIVFLEKFTKHPLNGKTTVREEILIEGSAIAEAVMAKHSNVRNFFLCVSISLLLAGFNLWAYLQGLIYWYMLGFMVIFVIGAMLSPLVARPRVTFTTRDGRDFKWIGEFLMIFDNRDWAKHVKTFCERNGITLHDRYYGGTL